MSFKILNDFSRQFLLLKEIRNYLTLSQVNEKDNTIQYKTKFIYIVGNTKQYNISYEKLFTDLRTI